MELKYCIPAVAVLVAVAFASGRYSVHQPQVKTIVDSKTNTDTKIDKDTHKKTETVIVKEPDGKTTTTTTTTEDTTTVANKTKNIQSDVSQAVTPRKHGDLNVSLIVAESIHNPGIPVYGASVTKQILGPVTIGGFFVTNGTFGVTVGINF